jgi:hypothetical protein
MTNAEDATSAIVRAPKKKVTAMVAPPGEKIQPPDDGPLAETVSTALSARQRRLVLWLAVAGAVAPLVVLAALVIPLEPLLTDREAWFMLHTAFGVIIAHAFAGGMATLLIRRPTRLGEIVRIASATGMAVVSWLTVLTGTWMVYPGYRAVPPEGAALADYPKPWLQDNDLYFWHEVGMEWKEHVGWITPLAATAVAFVVYRHGEVIRGDARLRVAVRTLFILAFVAAAVAAGLGALINAVAPNDFLNIPAPGGFFDIP